MSQLHTIKKSWHDASWLYEQLAFASAGDAILLYQDAVLATQSRLTLASFVAKCQATSIALYVLQDDCKLRGIENQYDVIQPVDYAGFVDLVEQHNTQCAW